MDLSGILLVSDLDGTLIGENFVVPQRNLDAIARFQQEGGSFAIATGRSILSGGHYAELTHPKGPTWINVLLLNTSKDYTTGFPQRESNIFASRPYTFSDAMLM